MGRAAVVGALTLFTLLAALFAVWNVVAPPLIEAMVAGHGLAPLDALLDAHRRLDPLHRDVAYYVRNGRTGLGRAVIVAAGAALVAIAFVRRRRVVAATRAYFTACGPALNLAVFRIALFVLFLLKVEFTPVAFYAQLPAVLLMPPPGLGWLPKYLPMSPDAVQAVLLVFRVSCVLAIVGLFTRPATIVALLSGAYAIAVPQLYGKMYADHHILWFAALLAVSPCGDVLSIDAIRAARRRGAAASPPPSRAYALPLRIVWLLLGIIYFFPGFWKIWRTGLAWVSADNMQHQMFLKWREFGEWTPPLRVDRVPLLMLLGALGTVVFELGFIALVVSSRLRPVAAAVGLVFHNLTWFFLSITFWVLQLTYVALIDWAALVHRGERQHAPAAPPDTAVPWATTVVAAVLVAGAVSTGTLLLAIAWPFVLYPSFASLAPTTRIETSVRAVDAAGVDREVDVHRLSDGLPQRFEYERLNGLVDEVMATPDPALRELRLRAVWAVLAPGDPTLRDARVVRFYRDMVTTIPERRRDNPLEREVVFELYAAGSSASSPGGR